MCLLLLGAKNKGTFSLKAIFVDRGVLILRYFNFNYAGKRPEVDSKCDFCFWNLLFSSVNMRPKELSRLVKQAVIRLENQTTLIAERAKPLSVAKSSVWNMSSAMPKGPKDYGRQQWL